MIRKRFTKRKKPNLYIKANHQVRFPQVRVLSDQGDMLGIMSSREAFVIAQEAGEDLVLVTEKSQPPVVRIIDLAKYKYQLKQKEAQSRKKSKKQDLKGVQFTPFMGESDFEARLKKVKTFLSKGHKVKLQLMFKGRQITKKEFGYNLYAKIIEETQDIAQVEIQPKMMGKKLIAQLQPIAKSGAKEKSDENI